MRGRRVIMIGTAILLFAVVSVAAVVIHRKSAGNLELETEFQDDSARMGIDYGGTFDEFNYNPDEKDDIEMEGDDLEDTQSDEGDYAEMEPNELLAELRKQRELEGGGIKRNRSAQTNIPDSNSSEAARAKSDDSTNDDFVDNYDDFEDDGEAVDISELGIVTYESKGYAQDEVRCNVDSREEAENVAAQISGTLLSWDNGVATIKIEGSVDEFLEKFEQQGSSLHLYRNYYY